MSKHWFSYAYPEDDHKVWISFSQPIGRDPRAFISELEPVDGGAKDIDVYRAFTGNWQSVADAKAEANSEADKIIAKLGL